MFVVNWIEDKASGYLKTGLQAGGTMAGNAVGGVGGLVESSGRSVGEGVTGAIGGVGNYINGYGNGIKGMMSADGPVNSIDKKAAATRSDRRSHQGEIQPQNRSKALSSSTGGRMPRGKPISAGSTESASVRLARENGNDTGSVPETRKAAGGKVRISPESRPRIRGGVARTPASTTPTPRAVGSRASSGASNPSLPGRSYGKAGISATSRTKGASHSTQTAMKAKARDPVGIEGVR